VRFEQPKGTPGALGELDYTNLTWDKPWNQYRGQLTSIERMPSYVLEPCGPAIALTYGNELDAQQLELTDSLTGRSIDLETFLQRRLFSDGLLIAHRGQVIYEKYFNGFEPSDQHLIHSCTKTLTTMQIGLAVQEAKIDLASPVTKYVEELAGIKAWQSVSVQNLLDMATGVQSDEHYENLSSMYYEYANAIGYWGEQNSKLTGALDFVATKLINQDCSPATKFNYASYNTNLLAVMLERTYQKPAAALYEADLFQKSGPEFEAFLNADPQGVPIIEGHLNLTLRDFYRWASMLHNDGKNLRGEQVIAESWVQDWVKHSDTRKAAFERSEYAGLFAEGQYHNQLWLPDCQNGISAMLGIYGQFCYSDRERDLLIIGLSSYPELAPTLMTAHMQELWRAISNFVDAATI